MRNRFRFFVLYEKPDDKQLFSKRANTLIKARALTIVRALCNRTIIQPQRIRALGSGYGSIGTREKQSMLCHARGEKDKILYSDKDPGQKGRNDGESDHSGTVRISERSGENDHMRQGERVCMLEGDRESTKLRYVLCRSVLCMAERNKRKSERIAQRILS